jgi:hypothetical protein
MKAGINVLKIIRRLIEERRVLNVSQFGFLGHCSTTHERTKLTDHITANVLSTTEVLLEIEKAFDPTWHLGLLCCIN